MFSFQAKVEGQPNQIYLGIARKWGAIGPAVVMETAMKIKREVQAGMPVRTGAARKSVQSDRTIKESDEKGVVYKKRVFSDCNYMDVIEEGRTPGSKWPPIEPVDVIRLWAKRKLGSYQAAEKLSKGKKSHTGWANILAAEVGKKQMDTIIFLIRRKIGVKGMFQMSDKARWYPNAPPISKPGMRLFEYAATINSEFMKELTEKKVAEALGK